jgi:DNA-damage-inducible protein D
MRKDVIIRLHANFERIVQIDPTTGAPFWCARDLQELLGYARWENFSKVVEKAITACQTAGYEVRDHFLDITKMVDLGSGAQREVEDVALTRYASYLIAQNGDPSKDQIAFAQTYFAVQTRKHEIIEKRIADAERVGARRKLASSERELSGIIFEHLHNEESFARIRSKGDAALFGGKSTSEMKERLAVPKSRPLADFLPTITIKAKDFANEITNFTAKQRDLRSETHITQEHVKNNEDVRYILTSRGIVPETLPPSEDIRRVERRLKADEEQLQKAQEALRLGGADTETT